MTKSSGEKLRNYIPDDLAFFILSKLPLKSLKRFRCVRKTWFALFENPSFMTLFRTNFISIAHSYYHDTSVLLKQCVYDPNNSVVISLYSLSGDKFENRVKLDYPNPFNEEKPQFHISNSGSITGILCVELSDEIIVWNPTTDEFKVLPHSSVVDSVPPYRDNLKQIYGFGYDPISEDYKIIRLVYYFPMDEYSILPPGVKWEDIESLRKDVSYGPVWEIYSLRCNLWRQIDVAIPTCCLTSCWNNVLNEGLYMDGICHWLSRCEKNKQHYLVSFYLTPEVCFTTLIPLDINADEISMVERKLLILNGAIASISWYYNTTTFHISILGELGVKESWTKLFVFELCPNIEYPVGAGKNGDMFFVKKDGELVYFDLCTHMIEELGGVKATHSSRVIIYNKSLISIEKISH